MKQGCPNKPLARSWDDVGRDVFTPEHYEFCNSGEMADFIAANPMAHIVSVLDGAPRITTAPMVFPSDERGVDPKRGGFVLWGHMAARNDHADLVRRNAAGVLLFHSPGAYVSPNWFSDEMTAPTWSYQSLQARGSFNHLSDDAAKLKILARTVALMEDRFTACGGDPWTMSTLDDEKLAQYLERICVFEFAIDAVEGVSRLNQEKSTTDMRSIMKGLSQSGQMGGAGVSALMKKNLE